MHVRVRHAATAAIALLCCHSVGCAPSGTAGAPVPDITSALDTVAIVTSDEKFTIGDIALLSNCSLIAIGARWGTVIAIDSTGVDKKIQLSAIEAGSALSVSSGSGAIAIITAIDPPISVLLSAASGNERTVRAPDGLWGASALGAADLFEDSIVAMAPFGPNTPVRRLPDSSEDAPSIVLLNLLSGSITPVGRMPRTAGRYLPALRARRVVSLERDTLRSLRLVDAVLEVFTRDAKNSWTLAKSVQLPKYIETSPATENAVAMPWISEGGPVRLTYLAGAMSAAFDPAGSSLFALRPYTARWQRVRDEFTWVRGKWETSTFGLEQYDGAGSRIAVFGVSPTTIQVKSAPRGHLLLREVSGRTVIGSIGRSEVSCNLPREIRLSVADEEPKPSDAK